MDPCENKEFSINLTIGFPRARQERDPVQFLLFSYSFGKSFLFFQIIASRAPLEFPPPGNPGSATSQCFGYCQ